MNYHRVVLEKIIFVLLLMTVYGSTVHYNIATTKCKALKFRRRIMKHMKLVRSGNKYKRRQNMTNFELITQSDITQLARFISKITKCNQCFLYSKCFECNYDGCKKSF